MERKRIVSVASIVGEDVHGKSVAWPAELLEDLSVDDSKLRLLATHFIGEIKNPRMIFWDKNNKMCEAPLISGIARELF